jgi:hypothetical protein
MLVRSGRGLFFVDIPTVVAHLFLLVSFPFTVHGMNLCCLTEVIAYRSTYALSIFGYYAHSCTCWWLGLYITAVAVP